MSATLFAPLQPNWLLTAIHFARHAQCLPSSSRFLINFESVLSTMQFLYFGEAQHWQNMP
eukprot:5746348-Amphidinium_carterae.1